MDEIVLSLKAFSERLLKKKPEDFVYMRVLKLVHGREKHPESQWIVLLDALRRTPV